MQEMLPDGGRREPRCLEEKYGDALDEDPVMGGLEEGAPERLRPWRLPPGVRKFRSVAEAHAWRDEWARTSAAE